MFTDIPDAATQAHLHTRARAESARLRQEAMDNLWRDAGALLQHSLQTSQALAQRSARRFRARLARHLQTRNAEKV